MNIIVIYISIKMKRILLSIKYNFNLHRIQQKNVITFDQFDSISFQLKLTSYQDRTADSVKVEQILLYLSNINSIFSAFHQRVAIT